jgi:hypothetical protein
MAIITVKVVLNFVWKTKFYFVHNLWHSMLLSSGDKHSTWP